jgi:hypothetical protein
MQLPLSTVCIAYALLYTQYIMLLASSARCSAVYHCLFDVTSAVRNTATALRMLNERQLTNVLFALLLHLLHTINNNSVERPHLSYTYQVTRQTL